MLSLLYRIVGTLFEISFFNYCYYHCYLIFSAVFRGRKQSGPNQTPRAEDRPYRTQGSGDHRRQGNGRAHVVVVVVQCSALMSNNN